MRLSELAMSRGLIEMMERHHPDIKFRQMILDGFFESIKGNNTQVEDFIKLHKTKEPILDEIYYPVSVAFLVGFDTINMDYTREPLAFIKYSGGDYIYSDGHSDIRFPQNLESNLSGCTITFHCKTIDESKELRTIIHLTFSDCKILETEI